VFTYGDEVAFEFAAIRSSLANLRGFPFIEKGMKAGLLALHGLHFDLGSGTLLSLDEETGRFVAVEEP
jgi:carbonic anhydrase